MRYPALFFDLDGTLVDSLPDLAFAVNQLRSDLQLSHLDLARVRSYVGDGATALVRRALPEEDFSQQMVAKFLTLYNRSLCVDTHPYPGIPQLLDALADRTLAVITNKPQIMAQALLASLGLARHFELILGGDSCTSKKPAPAQLHFALDSLGLAPDDCMMIGDHHTDLRAAKAAGIASCFCTWGYGNDGGETPLLRAASVAELATLLGRP